MIVCFNVTIIVCGYLWNLTKKMWGILKLDCVNFSIQCVIKLLTLKIWTNLKKWLLLACVNYILFPYIICWYHGALFVIEIICVGQLICDACTELNDTWRFWRNVWRINIIGKLLLLKKYIVEKVIEFCLKYMSKANSVINVTLS